MTQLLIRRPLSRQLMVVLCFVATGLGHLLAQSGVQILPIGLPRHLAPTLSPQSTQAQPEDGIDFVVADPSGAVIPHARISVFDRKRKLATGITDERGALSFSGVPEGQHQYKIKCRGLETYHGTVSVLPHQRTKVDVKLRLSYGSPVTEVN